MQAATLGDDATSCGQKGGEVGLVKIWVVRLLPEGSRVSSDVFGGRYGA